MVEYFEDKRIGDHDLPALSVTTHSSPTNGKMFHHNGTSDESFQAVVRCAARDVWFLSCFAAILEAHGLSAEERDAIWRAFEAAAGEPPSDRTPSERQ